jgi:hypothetical protein
MLRAVLYGHRSESAVVHGFQKGYFVTGDGKRCDPFRITDAHSRYLIRCQIVSRMDLSQGPSNLRSSHARVRSTSTDQNRQRRTVCGHRATGAVEAITRLDASL